MSLGDNELDDPQDGALPIVHYPQCQFLRERYYPV